MSIHYGAARTGAGGSVVAAILLLPLMLWGIASLLAALVVFAIGACIAAALCFVWFIVKAIAYLCGWRPKEEGKW